MNFIYMGENQNFSAKIWKNNLDVACSFLSFFLLFVCPFGEDKQKMMI